MVNENRGGLGIQPLAVLAPIACIAIFAIGTNLLAESVARRAAGIDRWSGARAAGEENE